jgi:hypothetical protein
VTRMLETGEIKRAGSFEPAHTKQIVCSPGTERRLRLVAQVFGNRVKAQLRQLETVVVVVPEIVIGRLIE